MNLEGNQRGGGKACADHILSRENDHVEVYELRGFASDNLHGAMNEIYAVSRGTKCTKYLYSMSVNPPPQEKTNTADYLAAINKAEQKLGLTDQPRGIVFHEKEGRRHAHVVWSRIDTDAMKAIPISHDHLKLKDLSRELYLEHGWKMPEGYAKIGSRDPKNFSLKEWQAAKRNGYDPRDVKAAIRDAWAISDSKAAFVHAMQERGLKVARGDRAGIVALNVHGDVQSIPRALSQDIKLAHVRDRLGHEKDLPSLAEAKLEFTREMQGAFDRHTARLAARQRARQEDNERRKALLIENQRAQRSTFLEELEQRKQAEALTRQARFRKGFRGIWDRLRGRHKEIKEQNEREAEAAAKRNADEKDKFIRGQLAQRQLFKDRLAQVKEGYAKRKRVIETERQRFERQREMVEKSMREPLERKHRTRRRNRLDKEASIPEPER